MKYNIDVTIINPKSGETQKLYLEATFKVVNDTYGNGIYLYILGRGQTNFERVIDLRYESVDTTALELVVLKFVYGYWSGNNGAWDVMRINIENVEFVQCSRKSIKTDIEMR